METALQQSSIFFVDDDANSRKLVELILGKEQLCSVTCFKNAADCLEALADQQGRCSLLITDVMMPGMDGLALLAEVKQLRPRLPVLIVTGYGDVSMAVKALKAGAMDFIEKPIDGQVLLSLVKKTLERSTNADELAGKSLTDSEKTILKLISEGKSNSEMAAFLHRSIRTVERHRYLLMRKLEVGSPAELTKVAIAVGLTSPDIDERYI
jgi:FixJ family two-component response regulator